MLKMGFSLLITLTFFRLLALVIGLFISFGLIKFRDTKYVESFNRIVVGLIALYLIVPTLFGIEFNIIGLGTISMFVGGLLLGVVIQGIKGYHLL